MADWGYDGKNGPDTWVESYPDARGRYQSPVDIITELVTSGTYHPPLSWSYGPDICKTIANTGSGWRVNVSGFSGLTKGPLVHNYELSQFHCHWGKDSSVGSEHVVDGKSYAGELHFVHWNKQRFSTFVDAMSSPRGLAVIGVFLEVGEKNSELAKLCEIIPRIADNGEEVPLNFTVDIAAMLPANSNYWSYDGSLTTPPCHESVKWMVFKNPITVSEEQLECFRHMNKMRGKEVCSEFVERNYRPLQPLNHREIFECLYAATRQTN